MRRLALVLLLLPGAAWADGPGGFGSPARFTEQGGEAIFRGVCAGCHMADGRGAVGAGAVPALRDDPRLADSAYPIAVVLHGLHSMPPLGRYLSDAQVAEVVGYIRSHLGNGYKDAPTAEAVRAAR